MGKTLRGGRGVPRVSPVQGCTGPSLRQPVHLVSGAARVPREVLDFTGAVLKTYTSTSANQYVRVPAPTPGAIFGIRFTQPT